ncbi:MAG: penicillin-binding protein 2 [Candidatus Doudnabacteria bacterium]|nr:penicillin-binding protein 2 [Candidatus Doudnabacteria bacterium]
MAKKTVKDLFSSRSSLTAAFLLLVLAIIVARLFLLQIIGGKTAREEAQNQHSIYQKLLPSRGEIKIVDKANQETFVVATNIKKYLVYAVPGEIQNSKIAADNLSAALGLDSKEVLEKISNQSRKYVPLKKQLSEEEQEKIKDLKLPGIYFDAEEARFYPQKNSLSQTLGFVGFKGDKKEGLYGLEKIFEKELAGTPGELRQEKDTSGAWIFGSQKNLTPAEDGVNLILTIDKTIQFKAENVIKEAVEKHGADSATAIVIDPKTGRLLALAGYPDFDPNEYNKQENPGIYLNKAVTGNYEPGSVFKPLTMAAAINENKITADTVFVDTGKVVEADGSIIKNSEGKVYGEQNMTQVLEKSINTGAIFAKEQIGNKVFLDYLKRFGFGKATGLELPESRGNLDSLKGNVQMNFDSASFGQSISVTPIQLVQAFTAIANGGKMMKPYLVQSKIFSDGKTVNIEPKIVSEALSAKTANTVAAMMVNVVENGHGKQAGVSGYFIAGKTGTAQVPRDDGKGYETDNNIGSFIGFGPVENPKFLMLIRVDHPRSVKYAESTAAPAFGQLAQFILNYYQIPPTREIK